MGSTETYLMSELNLVLSDTFVDEVYYILRRSFREGKFRRCRIALRAGMSASGDDAADKDSKRRSCLFSVKKLHELGADRVVGAGEEWREADDVDVFPWTAAEANHLGGLGAGRVVGKRLPCRRRRRARAMIFCQPRSVGRPGPAWQLRLGFSFPA